MFVFYLLLVTVATGQNKIRVEQHTVHYLFVCQMNIFTVFLFVVVEINVSCKSEIISNVLILSLLLIKNPKVLSIYLFAFTLLKTLPLPMYIHSYLNVECNESFWFIYMLDLSILC